nr:ribonuclease R [uncultured Eisenbergiella sp.]
MRILSLMEESSYVPMREKELACIMQVEPEDRPELKRILQELLAEGKVQINKRGRYSKPEQQQLTGVFTSHQKGFGFVQIDGREEDLYIPEDQVNGAYHLDTVEAVILPGRHGQRQEARISRIIARGTTHVVGTYQKSRSFGFVIPDNPKLPSDIFVSQERSKGAVSGSKVVVEITDYGGTGRRSPEGKIVEILGHINDPGVDIMSIVRSFDLPEAFPEKVMNQAERCALEVTEADRAGRLDLRELTMVTIDGEDAKDLDDAVSLTRDGENYCLGVHIADVTNYVQENSALDREALKRGTSVYLVDRVIPMLPHTLSNGICSLNAGEDRLALSCLMTVNPKGEVVDYRLAESVIHVNRRMSYTSVAGILEAEDPKEIEEYRELVPMFRDMARLSGIIRKRRQKRGAIDFDFPESKIILDKEGHPLEIRPYERNNATKLIEDFMLLANETVAQHFYWLQAPFVYRVHDNPDPEKIHRLSLFIHNFGYSMKAGQEEIHPMELQKLLDKIEGTPEEALISRLTLRSMKQAKYSTECTGHFGLASPYYCHFTSPIRRYPDLQIHRIIKEQLRGRLEESRTAHYEQILPQVAKQSSQSERRADEAERETEKLKKTEYMESHIGEIYEGVISGVTAWGLYVELPNTVEGLVHVSMLPGDYFFYDEAACEMRGSQTGKTYKLGEKLRIKVKFADRFTRTIDFILPYEEEGIDDGERSDETGSQQ